MKSIQTLLLPSEILASKVPLEAQVSGLTQTTDKAPPGALFFAIQGSRFDGHAFVAEAVAGGAMAAVVETEQAFRASHRAIWVASTRTALGLAASRWFGEPTAKLQLVGVTGTNGKTTTTFLLSDVWQAMGLKVGRVGTVSYLVGNHELPAPLTTPDPLLLQELFSQMTQAEVTHACMEVSSIALDQKRVAGCRFRVALFTNLTQDHLDYHQTMEAYFAAKRLLFDTYQPEFAIVNRDDPAGPHLARGATGAIKLSYAVQSKEADFTVQKRRLSADGIEASIQTPQGLIPLTSPLLGEHNLSNCLGVLATAYALKQDLKTVSQLLSRSLGAPGRLERVAPGRDRARVFVDYAHTDDALKNVLSALRTVCRGKLIAVFGCGGDRDRSKRPLMGKVAAQWSDILIATSDNPRTENPEKILDEVETGIPKETQYHRESDRRKAIELALDLAGPEDFVLIAGKGHETYQILGTEKVPFDDREVVRDYYKEI